jgi:hypothetical protein
VLQRLVWERLDDALAWLVSLGVPVVASEGNPRRPACASIRRGS